MLTPVVFVLLIGIPINLGDDTIVFTRGESGYFCIKVPSVLTTNQGTLLAFGEARLLSCGDYTQTDIVYKRSLDGGKTWSAMQILYRGNSSADGDTRVGNVAPVQLEYKQRILIPFCKNNLVVMQTYSDDDGLTFSVPQIIFNVTKPNWKWVDLGPPGGLLLKSGVILIPAYYSTHSNDNGLLSTGFVMLNNDNGDIDKWYLGGEFKLEERDFPNIYPNECQAVELLPDANSIFINARSFGTKRIGAYSHDGGLSFIKVGVLDTLVQPISGCQGSTVIHPTFRQLFYTGLAETTIIRSHLSLYTSRDSGASWSFIKTVFEGSSAYSSLTVMKDQSIGLLYEWANKTDLVFLPDHITFTVVWKP